ncbi:MAG: ATP-binding protein [Rhodobacteraceae bacterium]|nr:ATP-binding protein [Paracoccaceae bacterium]
MNTQQSINNGKYDYDITHPEPAALVESLRAFGYNLKTAIADLIDNSISAKAKNIWISFEWYGNKSYIVIKDDGNGMTENELKLAMRPGSKNPLEGRSPDDLGRFGLGLKTASFSQCRRLSVISKKAGGHQVTRCWDLDYINQTQEWRLLKNIDPDPLSITRENFNLTGTIVVWEKLDRVVGSTVNHDDNNAYKRFLEGIEEVKKHLGMVFHRFLEKPAGLKIWINKRQVVAWDPFLKGKKATQELSTEKLLCNGKQFVVVPYVLPHQSKITKEDHKIASGPKGWNAQQGFYVYRNERLLVTGDWLGLGFQKEEHYKLARIQIDLPNSMDSEWQIDVKKSRAKPPGDLRSDLKRIARITRERAVQIYRHRGKVIARRVSQNYIFLWEQKTRHGKYFYKINRKHPIIKEALETVGIEQIEPILRMLEETIPSQHITIANSEEPDKMGYPFDNCSYESVKPMIVQLFSSFRKSGCSEKEAIIKLLTIEPFNHKPEFIEVFQKQRE